jgi:hypothetical protein
VSEHVGPAVKDSSKRESRKFWVVSEGHVFHSTGWTCAPGNPDMWWFPQLGFSTSQIFDSEAAAKEGAAGWLREKIARLQKQLAEVAP